MRERVVRLRFGSQGAGLIQILIVVVVILVVTMVALKMYQRAAPPNLPTGAHPARAVLERVTLDVEGLTSETDALQVTEALRRVPGVAAATTDAGTGRAEVTYDPGRATPEQFIAAVERAGFRARR